MTSKRLCDSPDQSAAQADSVQSAARAYIERGWRIVPLKHKVPTDPETGKPLQGWQKLNITNTDKFNGNTTGVGVICDKVADIDLDSPMARFLAPRIMPPTANFGRESARVTHLVYNCPGANTYEKIKLPDGVIELRADGGHQTMFPGSIHPSGELVEWRSERDPASISIDDLKFQLRLVEIACIFCDAWQDKEKDNLITILSHVLYKYMNLPAEDIQSVADAILDYHNDDDRERRHKASSTVRGLAKGTKKPGLPKLEEIIGRERADRVRDLLGSGEDHEWPEPVDIFDVNQVDDCPLDIFPDLIREPVEQIAAAIEVPYECVLFPALCVTTWAAGARCQIKLKREQEFTQPAILYSFVAAKSGMGKSPAAKMILRKVIDYQRQLKRQYDVQLEEWEQEDKKTRGRAPHFHQFYMTNYTIEGMIRGIETNPLGVLVVLDELSKMIFQGGKYSNGISTDEQEICSMYDGGEISKIRAGKDSSLFVAHSQGNIFGNIQPDLLSKLVTDENKSLGLIARFGLSAMPKPVKRVGADLAVDEEKLKRFFEFIEDLMAIFHGDPDHKVTFRLDDEAQKLFNKEQKLILAECDEIDEPLSTHLAKYPGLLGRLSLALQLLNLNILDSQKTAENRELYFKHVDPLSLVVPKETVEKAIRFLRYLRSHAEVWYEVAARTRGNETGIEIAKHLILRGESPSELSVRDVYRSRRIKIEDKKTIEGGFEWLDNSGWGDWYPYWKPKGGGRPSAKFMVNPRIFDQ